MLCFKRKVYRYFEEEYEKLSKRKGNTEKVKISYTKISGPLMILIYLGRFTVYMVNTK